MAAQNKLLTILLFSISIGISGPAFGQDANSAGNFKPEQIDQMVAPIALYPDSVLAQILMASTYPLEVVQADRWA